MFQKYHISNTFSASRHIVLYSGDCMDLLQSIPNGSMQLIVTSPPFSIGKKYEKKGKSVT
jgi:DNA modification methylase